MNKLVNFIIRAAIALVILYVISFILAVIVTVICLAVNRIIAYRKNHRRYTDWEYKFSRCVKNDSNSPKNIERIFCFERFDRVLNVIESKEEVMVTTLENETNDKASEFAEWLSFKKKEQILMDEKLRAYYGN